MITPSHTLTLHSADQMETLGKWFAQQINPLQVVYLEGPLGAGKTTFVRGLLRGLGHHTTVKSPTYTMVESYALQGRTIHHFDLYRVKDAEELYFLGLRDYFAMHELCLIEWPEHGKTVLPMADLRIVIELTAQPLDRQLHFFAQTPAGQAALSALPQFDISAGRD